MKALFSFLLLLSFSFSGFAQADNHSKDEKVAVKAAEKWLKVVDEGEYGTSWDEAAAYFQANMTKDGWNAALEGILPALGKVKSRELVSARFLTKIPGGADGEYVMIRFKTNYENKAEAIETVTPQKGEDGQWRVCGYFIK